MSRRVQVITVPRDATMPAENITGPEWMAAQADIAVASSKADRADTRVVDVRKYGDIGTSDDSPTFIAALADLESQGGGVLTGPVGFYQFGDPVQHPPGVTIDFPLGTVFDFGSAVDALNGAMWRGEGNLQELPALSANIPMHGRTVSFAAAHDLVPGDWVLLYDSANYSWGNERTVYRAGEYVRVRSVSGNSITTVKATYDAYASGSTVKAYKLTPAQFQIRGVHFVIPTGRSGVVFDLATNIVMNNVSAEGGEHSLFGISRSVDIVLNDLRGWMTLPAATGTNYGLSITNCQDITINNPTLAATRHGFTTGGGDRIGAVTNRNITLNGGSVSSTSDGVAGCDLHGNSEWVWFNNVHMPNGLHIAGDHIRVKGGMVQPSASGIAIEASGLVGTDIVIDTDIQATRTVNSSATGLVYVALTATTVRDNGTITIKGRIDIGPYRASSGATSGIYVLNATSVVANVQVDVAANADVTSSFASVHGLRVNATGGQQFDNVEVTGTFQGCGIDIREVVNVYTRQCRVRRAPANGIYATGLYIHSHGNAVRLCGAAGISYTGNGKGSGFIQSIDDTSLDNNLSSGGAANTSILILSTGHCVYRGATVGDTRATPMQTRADQINAVATLHEEPAAVLGSVTTQHRNSVDTTVSV